MLYLYTGLPGAGKTLNAITDIQEQFKGRDIYYSGIKDLKLPWIEMQKPNEWYELPDNSVVVIDEAQRIFPVRQAGSPVPIKCANIEDHRHRGFDIVLITQDAKLLDVHVRRLVNYHRHVKRTFGAQRCTVFEWSGVHDPKDYHDIKKANSAKNKKYPKETFALYSSATIHTEQRKIPWKILVVLPLMLVFIGGGLTWAYSTLFMDITADEMPLGAEVAQDGSKSPFRPLGSLGGGGPLRPDIEPVEEYVAKHLPRFQGLDYTAPIYDEVRQPKTFPKPNCLVLGGVCRCYSQQATRLSTGEQDCRRFVDKGYFDYTREETKVAEVRSNREIASDYVLNQLLDRHFGVVRQHLEADTLQLPEFTEQRNPLTKQ